MLGLGSTRQLSARHVPGLCRYPSCQFRCVDTIARGPAAAQRLPKLTKLAALRPQRRHELVDLDEPNIEVAHQLVLPESFGAREDGPKSVEREAERLRELNQPNPFECIVGVASIAVATTRCCRQQAAVFVEPDGRRGNSRRGSEFADLHGA